MPTDDALRARRRRANLLARPDPAPASHRAASATSATSAASATSATSAASAAAVVDVVRRVIAVQAQAAGPARLAVRARSTGLRAADVDLAAQERAVVKTWALRGTLHLLAAGDVAWIVGLLGPVFARAGRRRREQLGLDEPTCERALAAIAGILAGSKPLTRAELIGRLGDQGVRIDAKTQAPPHLLGYAANSGLICRGPDAERDEPTYVLLEEWLGRHARNPFPRREDALAELAARYLAGYGPATVPDFATWSGLPRGEAKQAFAAIADRTRADGSLVALDEPGAPDEAHGDQPARLLGHFDPLLLGYAKRDLILAPQHAPQVQAGGGFIQPTILVGGRVVGTWALKRAARRAAVDLQPFGALPRGARPALGAEAADLGRFLGEDVSLA